MYAALTRCVTGSQRLDTLVIATPARDYPWLRQHTSAMAVTRHLARLLEIAFHFAREGREGASLGVIFVLGDRSTLAPYLRQLMLNPFQGHAQAARSIHNPEFLEMARELAAIHTFLELRRVLWHRTVRGAGVQHKKGTPCTP
jgi:hypothetical protein